MKLLTAVCLAALAAPLNARARTFDFSFDQFRAALDGKIREAMTDEAQADASTTRSCKKVKDAYVCTFNDVGFRAMVAGFERLDVVNGRFEQKLHLRAETQGGKVGAIQVIGSRADPVNLLQFIGAVLNVVQVLDPTAAKPTPGDGATLALVKELGLTRGDGAEDVGGPVTTIKPYALIRCLTMSSRVTPGVGCVFQPRS